MSLIENNEELEAIHVKNDIIAKYNKRTSKGELPASLDSFTIEKVIGKGGFSKVM